MNSEIIVKYTPRTTRLEYIDILKGIGIILMIMGHIGFGGIFDFYIHAFNMPLFFFVSGYMIVLVIFKVINLIITTIVLCAICKLIIKTRLRKVIGK